MTVPAIVRERLAVLAGVPDDEVDLAEGALALSALDRPDADPRPYRRHLKEVARMVAAEAARSPGEAATPEGRAAIINHVLFERLDYEGAEDDITLDAPTLMDAIDTRAGLPVALGILYLYAARSQGWEAEGLTFPSPFLVRLAAGGERVIVHPYREGLAMTARDMRAFVKGVLGNQAELAPHHYQRLSNRDILLRLQNHQKLRLLREERMADVLTAVEASMLLAPERSDLWQEAGLVNARLGRIPAAIAALETYLARAPMGADRGRTLDLLRQLRGQVGL